MVLCFSLLLWWATIPVLSETKVPETVQVEQRQSIERPLSVEGYVRSYFKDIPVMIEIARCESRFRQWDKDGNVLKGKINPLDLGVMQINAKYNLEDSKRLGYDINTLEGNVRYARHLYEQRGTQPWDWSRQCWEK